MSILEPLAIHCQRRELMADELTPVSAYRRLRAAGVGSFLFESVSGGEQVSRFSFLGTAPRASYEIYPDRVRVSDVDGTHDVEGPPLRALKDILGRYHAESRDIPFLGGYVGYFGYDLIRLKERLGTRPPDPFALPLAWLGRFDSVVIFDHARQKLVLAANAIPGLVDDGQAARQLSDLADVLTSSGESYAEDVPDGSDQVEPRRCSLSDDEYAERVSMAQELIRRGEIFQVVLSRRWVMRTSATPLSLYRSLRLVNPSPYMVLLETPRAALVGASPEMLVRKTGDRIVTRPIAGTRPRGESELEDRALAAELRADPKENAEHVMLVDLARNDLGRVAVAGSVRVPELMGIERYSHVMHLVSGVEARLRPDHDALDLLLSCFPAGTVSGAPKIRAMQVIDELEPEARGPYAGAVGYLSFTGDLDTAITIRTLLLHDGELSITAGAGIVADSDPASEARESENKAAALLAAARRARFLERSS